MEVFKLLMNAMENQIIDNFSIRPTYDKKAFEIQIDYIEYHCTHQITFHEIKMSRFDIVEYHVKKLISKLENSIAFEKNKT